jgi:hypothetical protein
MLSNQSTCAPKATFELALVFSLQRRHQTSIARSTLGMNLPFQTEVVS